jgi:predicted flap endonuclease-1-like 5' DNA nuclease
VTVEHEPATASEDAVKGTDTASDSGPTTATDSTADAEVDVAAETGDAASDEGDGTDVDESEADESVSGGAPTDPAPDAELEDIKGIGPTYAERLREAGVGGVGALAAADPASLSEETDIAESRVENWVEQAKLY